MSNSAAQIAELTAMFGGKVQQQEYVQSVGVIKWRNETVVDGVVTSWAEGLHVYTAVVVEKVFRWEGLSYSAAHATDAITVTDVTNVSYTVPLSPELTQPTYTDLSWEKHSVVVSRGRMSPHLWTLEVTVRDAVLYEDGAVAPNQN